MNMKRVGLSILLIMLTMGCSQHPFGNTEAKSDNVQETSRVEKLVIQESVTVTGNIAPLKTRKLGFSQNGKIIDIAVVEGDHVKSGTILARIDASSDEYNIEAMTFELEQIQFTESPRKIELKEKELQSLRDALNNKIITAPFSGVIVEINRKEGEINLATSGEGYIMKLIDDSSLMASVVVDELDIARIKIGQKAVFSFDAIPGETFLGRVSKIAHIGRLNTNGLPVVDVELIIDNPDPRIFIPYSFKVEIVTDAPAEFLVVSEKSVLWENDQTYVNLRESPNSSLIKREVKIREWKDGKTIILDGVQQGDIVLINPPEKPQEESLWM